MITRSPRNTRFRRLVKPYWAGSSCKVLNKRLQNVDLHLFLLSYGFILAQQGFWTRTPVGYFLLCGHPLDGHVCELWSNCGSFLIQAIKQQIIKIAMAISIIFWRKGSLDISTYIFANESRIIELTLCKLTIGSVTGFTY